MSYTLYFCSYLNITNPWHFYMDVLSHFINKKIIFFVRYVFFILSFQDICRRQICPVLWIVHHFLKTKKLKWGMIWIEYCKNREILWNCATFTTFSFQHVHGYSFSRHYGCDLHNRTFLEVFVLNIGVKEYQISWVASRSSISQVRVKYANIEVLTANQPYLSKSQLSCLGNELFV